MAGVRGLTTRVLTRVGRRLTKVEMARPYVVRVDPSPELHGLLAVVTGGSGAIGRAISFRLALSGAEVHVLGRSTARLDAVVDEIRGHGGIAHVAHVDLEDDEAVARFFASLATVDILVNCAGGSARGEHAPVWDQSLDVVDRILAVNLRGGHLMRPRSDAEDDRAALRSDHQRRIDHRERRQGAFRRLCGIESRAGGVHEVRGHRARPLRRDRQPGVSRYRAARAADSRTSWSA